MTTAGPPERPAAYEFTPEQDRLFADLAARMALVGWVFLVLAALGIGLMIYSMIRRGPVLIEVSSVILLFVGGWTLSASRAFRRVAHTQGRDVPHVLQALGDLRNLYAFLQWVILVGIGLTILLYVLAPPAR